MADAKDEAGGRPIKCSFCLGEWADVGDGKFFVFKADDAAICEMCVAECIACAVHRRSPGGNQALSAPTAESGKDSSPSPEDQCSECEAHVTECRARRARTGNACCGTCNHVGHTHEAEPAPVAEAPERVTADQAWILLTSIMAHQDNAEQRQQMRRFVHQQEQSEREVAELRSQVLELRPDLDEAQREVDSLRTQLTDANLKAEGLRVDNAELRGELDRRKETEAAALKEMAKARSKAMDEQSANDLLRWLGHDKVDEFESGSLVKKLWDKAKELEAALNAERRRVTWHRENLSKALGSYHGVDLDEPLTLEAIEKELAGDNGLVASKDAGWAIAKARLADIDALRTKLAESERKLASAELSASNWKRNWEIASKHEVELEAQLRALNDAAADLVAEAVGPYDPPQRGSNLEKLYRLVSRPTSTEPVGRQPRVQGMQEIQEEARQDAAPAAATAEGGDMSDPYREEALRLLIGRWESRDDEGRLLIDTISESLARSAEVERLALAISAELRRDEGDLLSILDFAVRRLPPAERGGAINEILFRLDRVRANQAGKVSQ